SRRFRSASVSPPATRVSRSARPTSARTSRPFRVASPNVRVRARAPTRTFSKMGSPWNGFTIWKVRASPRWHTWRRLSPRVDTPSKRTSPTSVARNPEMRWNSVVLPAPFGPMSPTISPGATSKLTPETACSPPKRLRTPTTSRSAMSGGRATARPRAPESRVDALGQEQDDADEEQAVDHEVEARPSGTGEVNPRDLGQRREDERAQEQPEERPRTSHHGADDDVHRKGDPEHRIRLEREQVIRVEGAAEPRHERGQDDGVELVPHGVDAQRLGGVLVLADRSEVRSETTPLDAPDDGRRQQHQREGDIVVRAVVPELELPGVPSERDVEAEGSAHRL